MISFTACQMRAKFQNHRRRYVIDSPAAGCWLLAQRRAELFLESVDIPEVAPRDGVGLRVWLVLLSSQSNDCTPPDEAVHTKLTPAQMLHSLRRQ